MKKLMIAAAIVCAAALAQANTVKWGSGVMYGPTADGSIAATYNEGTQKYTFDSAGKIGTSYNVLAFAWESLSADAVAYTAGDLFKWYQDGASATTDPFGTTLTALKSGVDGDYNASGSVITLAGKVVADPAASQSVSAAILYVLTDSNGDAVWYMENSATKAGAAGVQSQGYLAEFIKGNNATPQSGNIMAWQSVPEPTSGLLLLLGVAGLALRRRRA